MKLLIVTNTFTPHVGGVARSVEAFSRAYRERGHDVLIIAPEFPRMPEHEPGVVRVPAWRRFNGTDFSVRLPIPAHLREITESFSPDVVHSQHPFLLGATALRLAHRHGAPLVFTHHTLYEAYTHYVPGDSPALKRFVIAQSTGYANLSDHVFAPSESIADLLQERGVTAPIDVVPTGVDTAQFAAGSGTGMRQILGIPSTARVIGHVGRLAKEKNLPFLIDAVCRYLRDHEDAVFLLVGDGPYHNQIRERMETEGMAGRFYDAGVLSGPLLVSAYKAMDVFVISSTSETQGMVVTEALAAGVPVVALDGPGVREVVKDRHNGRLLPQGDPAAFAEAIGWVVNEANRDTLRQGAQQTVTNLSLDASADKALAIFEDCRRREIVPKAIDDSPWETARKRVQAEWELLANTTEAASAALMPQTFFSED